MTSITNRLGPALQQDRTMRYISDAKSAVAEATDAAMTGLSVNDPSDAPHLWPEIYGLEDGVRDQSQYMENSDSAKMLLSTVDTTLAEATNVVTKALEIAVTFSSDTHNASNRQTAAVSIDGLIQEMINLANTEVAGRYVFAGKDYDNVPFSIPDGTYSGDNEQPASRIGTNNWVTTGYDGSTIFNIALQSMTDLADALRTGTGADVAAQLPGLHTSSEDLIESRQRAGYDFIDADDAQVTAESLGSELKSRLSELVGADPAEAYSRLAQVQSSYQAVLQMSAQGQGQNLFSLIR